MMIREEVLLIILGSALVTMIPRVMPLMVMSKLNLPSWLLKWLDFVPIAVISALIGQQLFVVNDSISLSENYIELLAAIPTFLIAIKTRSLLITVLSGIVAIIILNFFLS